MQFAYVIVCFSLALAILSTAGLSLAWRATGRSINPSACFDREYRERC
jgi:hypothetical protein